jgi:hypothetical protein
VRRSAAAPRGGRGYSWIMRTVAIRPGLQFGVLAAFVLAAESAALASRSYPAHPLPLRAAVIFDLCTVLPGAWWLLVVRRGQARPRTTLRVAVAAVALCALLFGNEVRLLAVPLELGLVALAVISMRMGRRRSK